MIRVSFKVHDLKGAAQSLAALDSLGNTIDDLNITRMRTGAKPVNIVKASKVRTGKRRGRPRKAQIDRPTLENIAEVMTNVGHEAV